MATMQVVDTHRRLLLTGFGALSASALSASALTRTEREAGERSPTNARIALIGDIPYSRYEEQRLLALWQQLPGAVDLVIHVGDIKSGLESCSNELISRRISLLQQCPCPLILVPGDNEWTDCNRVLAGEFDPLERLAWLRRHVFSRAAALGASWPTAWSPLHRQSDGDASGLPENFYWEVGDVGFMTLNVPGSNNGQNSSGIDDADLAIIRRANERWLRLGFQRAVSALLKALIIVLHADMGFEREHHPSMLRRSLKNARSDEEDGYARFRRQLIDLSDQWPGTVLLLNGDSHRFRVDQLTARLTRVQCFGSPFNASWVYIERALAGSEPFSVEVRQVGVSTVSG